MAAPIFSTEDVRVYEATSSGVQRTAAGNGVFGCTGQEIHSPYGLALDGAGNLYIADESCNVIWKVTSSGIAPVAGNGTAVYSPTEEGGPATNASLDGPRGVAVDADGNLYIADWGHNRIRKVWAVDNTITTIAGNGAAGYAGDGGPAAGPLSNAMLNGPYSIAVGPGGRIYFGDSYNHSVRELIPWASMSTTLAVSPTSATAGVSVTLTATVMPASGITAPTGTVTFKDGTTTIGTGTLSGAGMASYSTTSLAADHIRSRPPTAVIRATARRPQRQSA
jgi:hypothetical protein